MNSDKTILHVGSFQPQFKTSLMADMDVNGEGNGIYSYLLDESTGELEPFNQLYGIINPAKFCCNNKNMIFAASDTNDFINWNAGSGGGIYSLNQDKNELNLKDFRSSCGVRAVDVCCDMNGEYIIVLNQGSLFCTTQFVESESGKYTADIHFDEKAVVLFKMDDNGALKVCDRYILPESESAVPQSIKIDKDNYIYIVSSNTDNITIMKLDTKSETLLPVTVLSSDTARGLKDIELHHQLPVFYISCSESGEILVYYFDKEKEQINLLHKAEEEKKSNPGPIVINSNNNHLYSFDSKHKEAKVYAITQEGKLVLKQRKTIDANIEHSFFNVAVSKSGKWLLCTDMLCSKIYILEIMNDGQLGENIKTADSKTPTGMILI